jgi:hypothetical protein
MRLSLALRRPAARRRRPRAAALVTTAAVLALLPALGACGDDPSGPPSAAAEYRMRYFADGLVPESTPLADGAVLRVASGTLTLRQDGTYELRVSATRDRGGVSTPLPAVAAAGTYTLTRERGDDLFDYSVTFADAGPAGDAVGFIARDGQLTAGPFEIGGVLAVPTFQR